MTRAGGRCGFGIVLAALTALPGAAAAQSPDLSGQWGCQTAYAEYNRNGYVRGHNNEFVAALYPNGSYQAAGNTTSGAGVVPFQAQGQWRYDPASNELVTQGMSMSQYGMQAPLVFGGRLSPDGGMVQSNIEGPDSTGSYVAQRLAMMCRRQ